MDGLTDAQVLELVCSEEYDQSHLFPAGQSEDVTGQLIAQLRGFDKSYPGGVINYIRRARKLLQDSAADVNPFEGFQPSIPAGESVAVDAAHLDNFMELERLGMAEMAKCTFVLVAGGLGERLGYSSIKVGLPVELVTGTVYLQLYIEYIRAYSQRAGADLPLAIMTSDDTHTRTVELLEQNHYFGMNRALITIMKQEKVPALIDNRARFALEKGLISAKPHGHGDVHTLLYQYGLPQKWVAEGRKWVFFFQDTNALAFTVLPSLLGVSARNRFEMNFLTFMRFPREAVGGIMKLTRGEENMTINVEYNQIEALLKSSGWHKEGDASNGTLGLGTADLAQYSPFPGNSNTLVFSLPEYLQTLERTGGAMPEFVNPKYADATKTLFKSATRLECMMQDYPKLLASGARIGFTQYDRWVCFSAVKNNLVDAAVKSQQGLPPQCAGTGEAEYYSTTCRLMQLLGVEVGPDSDTKSFAGITYNFYPKVVIKPSFACTLYELKERIRGRWRIAPQACLVLEGRSTQFTDLVVEGVLRCGDSAPYYVPVEPSDPEYVQIRGFKLHN